MARRLTSALDEPRPFPKRRAAAAGVAVVLVAGIALALQGRQAGEPASPASSDAVSALVQTDEYDKPGSTPWEGRTRQVDLYADGWTMATLGDAQLVAYTDVPGTATPLVFSPVPVSDVQGGRPDVVRQALSRMGTGDSALACDQGGCSGSRDVSPEWLDDPGSIPGWGASYERLGIRHGLWRARAVVPEAAENLTVSGPGWTGRTMPLAAPAAGADGQPDGGSSADVPLLGAAWGIVFPVDASWAGSSAIPYRRPPLPVVETSGTPDAWEAISLATGLADTDSASVADQLTDTQLTYFTSPVTGCGVVAACVPRTVPASTSGVTRDSVDVCDEFGGAGTIVLVSGTVTVELPAPVHVNGAWGELGTSDFPDQAGSSVLGYTGLPPLTGPGTASWQQAAMVLLDWEGQTVELAGARNDAGTPSLTSIDTSTAFGGEYQPCQWR